MKTQLEWEQSDDAWKSPKTLGALAFGGADISPPDVDARAGS